MQTSQEENSVPATSISDQPPVEPAPPVLEQSMSGTRGENPPEKPPATTVQEMDTHEAGHLQIFGNESATVNQEEAISASAPISSGMAQPKVSAPKPGDEQLPEQSREEQTSSVIPPENPASPVAKSFDGAADTSINDSTKSPQVPASEVKSPQPPSASLAPAPAPATSPMMPDVVSNDRSHSNEPSTDQVMQEAPASPPKISRPRDEEEATDAPAAKRTKTEVGLPETESKMPPTSSDPAREEQPDALQQAPKPMTKPQQKHIQRAISNVKRIAAAKSFLIPVDPVALHIPNYFDYIKEPMDLKTLEDNLRAEKYPTVESCFADFNLIVKNSQLFNGNVHPVTQSALAMKASFDKHMEGLPSADVTGAAPSKKKAPDATAIRAPPARRESRTSLPGMAGSPVSANSSTLFALDPQGMPLIRRDSTIDGRPKREIHRPAPRDLPYTHQKPKKKKYQWELKFCDQVLKEITKPRNQAVGFPFLAPVDPVALNIPNYLKVIKKPMDFGTIRQKLDRGEYENAKEFEADARQVFKNCYLFNPEGDSVNKMGHQFEAVFDEEWSKKADWLEENTPSSGQRSPASSDEEDSEEEEDDEEDIEEQTAIVAKLQKQIAEMSKQVEMITSKKNKTPPAPSKKVSKSSKGSKKEVKKAAPPPPKAEKKTAPKPAKKAKTPYVTYEQKQDISSRINSLPDAQMTKALAIIRKNMPNLKGIQDDELELDIDELNNDVLYELLLFVRKHVPRADDSPMQPVATASTAAPARKKNKPMSKHEQEARIAQVQSGLSAFQKGGSSGSCRWQYPPSIIATDHSPDPELQQSIENNSSGPDDDDEEDSESEEE